jgi:hypothetical protein
LTSIGASAPFEATVARSGGRKPLVARFGGIALKRQKKAVLRDRVPGRWEIPRPKELVLRLVAGRCEICGQSESIRVHHIRKLTDLDRLGPEKPAWAKIMAKRRRKSLVVCETCHDDIHSGQPVAAITE